MRAAIVREYAATPEVGEFDDPAAAGGQAVVEVLAAGLNPVDLRIASGQYVTGPPPLPHVAGREGVGRTPDGARVYFDGAIAPYGSFAERSLIEVDAAVPLPDGLDDGLACALGIAGLAAWLSLDWRAGLRHGETVLVLGASGVVGQIAVQAAKLLGAGRVVAAGRSAERLERAAELGADATVQIGAVDDLAAAFEAATEGRLDVVVDPLWGEPAAAAVAAASPNARVVQLGQSAGATATLPSATIRSRMLAILGHTNFGVPPAERAAAYQRLAEHAAAGRIEVDVERVPLERAPEAWERLRSGAPHQKLVIVP